MFMALMPRQLLHEVLEEEVAVLNQASPDDLKKRIDSIIMGCFNLGLIS
jgi:hypothetical protein